MKKLSIILIFFFTCLQTQATTYYVSTSGSASNTGTSTGSPWNLAKVNSFAASFVAGDNILFNRGDVFYGSLVISRSGLSGLPITLGAYGSGANPVITGFTNVTAWTNLGGNIWESTSAVSTLSTCNMVVVNGVNTAMGRTPNYPTYYHYLTRVGTNGTTSSGITSNDVNGSATNWTGSELVVFAATYTVGRHPVTSNTGTTVIYNSTGNPDNQQGFSSPQTWMQFFFQNDTRTLDVQNEWYYNPSTKKIRIYSTSSPTNVQVATVENTVNVGNHPYITFDGISFTGSNGDALLLSSTAHLVVKNCTFNFIGRDVVFDGGGNSKIDNCTISNCNNFGIDFKDNSSDTVTNNTIKNIGMLMGMGAIPTQSLVAVGIDVYGNNSVITGNTIDTSGLLSVRFGGDNSLIKNNFAQHFCFGNGVKDGGGFYMYHGGAGNVNTNVQLIDNISMNGGSDGMGIYFDDYVNGIICQGNSVANCYAGYQLHNVHDFIFRDNTSYNSSRTELYLLMDDNTANNSTNITLKNNILFPKNNRISGDNWCMWNNVYQANTMPLPFTSDSNYFCRPINPISNIIAAFHLNSPDIFTSMNLGMWKTRNGTDANSQISPATISNTNQLLFVCNPTDHDSTVSIPGSWADARNVSYSTSTVLHPFTSLVLISTGSLITPSITWPYASVTYPNGLGAGQLNAVAMDGASVVPGTHSYTPGTGTIGNVPGISVTDNFTPSDGLTYSTATKTVTIPVNPQSVSLSFGPDTIQTYTGGLLSPTLTATPSVSTSVTLNGTTGGKSQAGTYTAFGAVTDPNSTATPVTATFTINKATATITAINQIVNYDGLTYSIPYTTSPAGLNVTHTLTAPSALGTYSDTLRMVEANYQATEIIRTLTIVTNPAIIFISDSAKIFNTTAQGVTVTCAYSYDVTYDGSATVPTNAGTYQVIATITDGIHTGADTANLIIFPKAAILSWSKPVNVPEGATFSPQQLRATADVPGTWTYNYAIGQIIPLGITTLTGTFTPTSSNYSGNTITTTVTTFNEDQLLKFYITNNFFEKQ